jgi:5-methylcytosine-specific restriction endonuclease McrA
MLPGVWKVWGSEPSHSQGNSHLGDGVPMESRWSPETLERDCRGQNSMVWDVIYVIENLLKCRCLKWACIAHLNTWNTSYAQKEGQKSNWQFNSRPLKIGNQPDLLGYRWRATYHWNDFDEGYNFALDLISIGGLLTKLWRPKVAGVSSLAISGLPLGSPKTKSHLDVAPVGSHIVYYKGEGGGFPQVRAMVNLVCSCCSWLVLAPKVL